MEGENILMRLDGVWTDKIYSTLQYRSVQFWLRLKILNTLKQLVLVAVQTDLQGRWNGKWTAL